MSKEIHHRSLSICDECRCQYYSDSSQMTNLCPECAHILYGFENCFHLFESGRCYKCFWDGSGSKYLHRLRWLSTTAADIVEVYDSYKFSDGRIVAFLKSSTGKLPNETVLEDSLERKWTIKQYYWTTGSPETYEKREKEEAENIFQYLLEGVGPNEKPTIGVKLIVIKSP